MTLLLLLSVSQALAQPRRSPRGPARPPPAAPAAAPQETPGGPARPADSTDTVVSTRPVDRATVRIVSLLGVVSEEAQGNRTGRRRLLATPNVAHGSGLAISADGLILTARHVVADADVLTVMLPGSDRALPAAVVFADAEHDIAFLRVAERTPDHLPLPASVVPLQTLQRVSATGYPLDVRERRPAAAAGTVSRINNDGRIQLAMAVNPGNSGGPVLDEDGRLIGVVSQGADPSHGAQGITLVEPLQVILQARERVPQGARGEGAATQEVAQLVADLVRAGPWGLVYDEPVHRRLIALSEANPRPEIRVLIAAHFWNVLILLLETRGDPRTDALSPDDQRLASELTGFMVTICTEAQRQDPTIRRRYPFAHDVLTAAEMLSRHSCGGDGQGCCYGARCSPGLTCAAAGVCVAPRGCAADADCAGGEACAGGYCGPRPPVNHTHLQLRAGMFWDDDPQASTINGGYAGGGVSFHIGPWGPALVQASALVGLDFLAGAWRGRFAMQLGAHVGAQVSVGARYRGVARVLYTPGFVLAESRTHFAALSYRLELLAQLGSILAGVTWQEAQRDADSPMRLFGALVEFGW